MKGGAPLEAETLRPVSPTSTGRVLTRRSIPPRLPGTNILSLARSAPLARPTEPAPGTFIGGLVRSEDLSVVFQPIVATDTGRVFACEALVRCGVPEFRNPEHLFREAV